MNEIKENTKAAKSGYKQTKLGWIPEDWEIKEINKKIELSKDRFDPRKESDFFKCIELENINKETYSINGYFDSRNQKSNKNVFRRGDILFGKLRPNLRKYWLAEFDGVCSTEIWVLRGKAKELDNFFLGYFVQQERFYLISNVTSGSKMPRADWKFVQNYPMLFPPIKEQKAIADCLGTWDNAITKLTDLIIAKETHKKALMQQLLTGKKRLPGFDREWEIKSLSEISTRVTRKNKEANDNVVTISAQRGFIRQEEFFNKRVASDTLLNYTLVHRGEYCYNKSYSSGYPMGAFKRLDRFEKAVVTTLYICFKLKEDVNSDFMNHFFEAGKMIPGLMRIAQEGGRAHGLLNISLSDFFGLTLKLPLLKEQTAIANILNTADKEIQLLKEKLEELKLQKKGLMQQLLTGKKRLKVKN